MLWVLLWVSISMACAYVILTQPIHWSLKVVLGLIMGHCGGILSYNAHEILHGGMGGSERVQRILGNVCGLHLAMPSELWISGHTRRHHAHTNKDIKDVDTLGLLKKYENQPGAQKIIDRYPGNSRWSSLIFFTYGILYQNWHTAKRTKGETGKKMLREIRLMVAFWVIVAVLSGFDFIYTVVIPFMTANVFAWIYIGTQHWMRPLAEKGDCILDLTLGMTQPRWLEVLHFYSGYHAEHHLFPSVPFNKLPVVRKAIMEAYPDRLAVVTTGQALKWMFLTPRIYADSKHLVDPRNPAVWFDLLAFERAIIDPEIDLSKCTLKDFQVPRPV